MLFLVFDPALVRPVARQRPINAYAREFHRLEWLLTSARRVNTTLPIVVAVGGSRCLACERNLSALGATMLPIAPVRPPPWASSVHRQTFHKLRALSMIQYEKGACAAQPACVGRAQRARIRRAVVLIDNDCTLAANIDHLASVAAPAAVWHPEGTARVAVR